MVVMMVLEPRGIVRVTAETRFCNEKRGSEMSQEPYLLKIENLVMHFGGY